MCRVEKLRVEKCSDVESRSVESIIAVMKRAEPSNVESRRAEWRSALMKRGQEVLR